MFFVYAEKQHMVHGRAARELQSIAGARRKLAAATAEALHGEGLAKGVECNMALASRLGQKALARFSCELYMYLSRLVMVLFRTRQYSTIKTARVSRGRSRVRRGILLHSSPFACDVLVAW